MAIPLFRPPLASLFSSLDLARMFDLVDYLSYGSRIQ